MVLSYKSLHMGSELSRVEESHRCICAWYAASMDAGKRFYEPFGSRGRNTLDLFIGVIQ
jgi:hypothetical protein